MSTQPSSFVHTAFVIERADGRVWIERGAAGGAGEPPDSLIYGAPTKYPITPLPCHISFLWTAITEAMIDLLSPFLPLAKLLRLFLLDFDLYIEQRDGEKVADSIFPVALEFFERNAE